MPQPRKEEVLLTRFFVRTARVHGEFWSSGQEGGRSSSVNDGLCLSVPLLGSQEESRSDSFQTINSTVATARFWEGKAS